MNKMQQDLDRAYTEAAHYIAMDAKNFSVHVGDIEISAYGLPENKPRSINRYKIETLSKKINKIIGGESGQEKTATNNL